jgi:biopolymer transport protein ExbD
MQVMGRSARIARHHKRHDAAEINLTSMIDMMTILVFFLLIHGGFIRLAILELNLPASQSVPSEAPPSFQLEITVRKDGIEVGDRSTGLLTRIEKADDTYNFPKLTQFLTKLKLQFPEKSDATLLLEPDVPYEVLVAVMDRVRVAEARDETIGAGRLIKTELFPEISIGDAPVLN